MLPKFFAFGMRCGNFLGYKLTGTGMLPKFFGFGVRCGNFLAFFLVHAWWASQFIVHSRYVARRELLVRWGVTTVVCLQHWDSQTMVCGVRELLECIFASHSGMQ